MTAVITRSFYVEQVRNVTVVSFTIPSIEETNYEFVSDEMFEFVENVIANGPIQVVVDFGSVRQIDDWGLALLRAFHETIETNGGTTILCRIHSNVASAIRDAGLSSCFQCCETRSEAISAF